MTITALVHQLNSRDFLLHLTPLWVLSMLINRSPVRCRRRGGERSVLHYWMLSKPPDSLFFIMSRCLWGSQQSTQTVRWFGASSSSFMDTVKLLSLRDSAKLFLHVQNTAANALIIWHFYRCTSFSDATLPVRTELHWLKLSLCEVGQPKSLMMRLDISSMYYPNKNQNSLPPPQGA